MKKVKNVEKEILIIHREDEYIWYIKDYDASPLMVDDSFVTKSSILLLSEIEDKIKQYGGEKTKKQYAQVFNGILGMRVLDTTGELLQWIYGLRVMDKIV